MSNDTSQRFVQTLPMRLNSNEMLDFQR